MKLIDITRDEENSRYILEFSSDDGTVKWFKFLNDHVIENDPEWREWADTVLKEYEIL